MDYNLIPLKYLFHLDSYIRVPYILYNWILLAMLFNYLKVFLVQKIIFYILPLWGGDLWPVCLKRVRGREIGKRIIHFYGLEQQRNRWERPNICESHSFSSSLLTSQETEKEPLSLQAVQQSREWILWWESPFLESVLLHIYRKGKVIMQQY